MKAGTRRNIHPLTQEEKGEGFAYTTRFIAWELIPFMVL